MNKSILVLVLWLIFITTLQAQTNQVSIPFTNGEIKALAAYGDTIIVGGNFTKAYSTENASENIAYFDTLTGNHTAIKLKCNGGIQKIIPDETKTGFYVSGWFNSIGDSARSGVAHIDTTGKVTNRLRSWKITGIVNDMVLRGDTLIAAVSASGIYRANINPYSTYLRGISLPVGTINSANLPTTNGHISSLVVDAFGARYICGSFTQVGNQSRNGLAKIDSMGNLLPWCPILPSNQSVGILFLNESTIILGGGFTTINGQMRSAIAEVDTVTGRINTALNLKIERFGNGWVSVRSIDKWQNNLVIGGSFSHINDSLRLRVALINLTTRRVTSNSISTADFAINKVLVVGDQLYYAGIGVSSVSRIGRVNLLTGVENPIIIDQSSSGIFSNGFFVEDLIVKGDTIYAAGGPRFPSSGSSLGIVAINTITGDLVGQFDISEPTGALVSRIILHNSMLYASGRFTQISGNKRDGLAVISTLNHTISPLFSTPPFISYPSTISVLNNRLLINGTLRSDFVGFNNDEWRTRIIAYHTTSDSLFNIPHQMVNLRASSLLLSNDTLFVAGSFTIYGRNRGADSTRSNFAAIDLLNYNVLSPNIGTNGGFYTMVKRNNSIILGGDASGHPSGILSLDLGTMSVSAFPRAHTGSVNQMCLVNDQLYIAGKFTLTGGATASLISTSPLPSGNNTTWVTDYTSCNAIFPYQNRLYTSGTYSLNGNSFGQIRVYALPSNNLLPPVQIVSQNQDVPTGSVNTFAIAGRKIIVAGGFNYVGGGINTKSLFAYRRSSGGIIPQSLSLNTTGFVNSLAIHQNTLYVGGSFDSVNFISRRNLASINLTSCTVAGWNPNANNQIRALHVTDSSLFVGGDFTSILGQSRNGLSLINLSSNALNTWSPMGTGTIVMGIESNNRAVFVSLNTASTYNGRNVNRLFSMNKTSLLLDSFWNPTTQFPLLSSNPIYSMKAINSNLYVLHQDTTSNNVRLLKVNTITGNMPIEWSYPSLSFDSKIRLITPYKTGLITANFLIDTVQGNRTIINEYKGFLFGLNTNASVVQGNKLIFGGIFNSVPGFIQANLHELDLLSTDLFRFEIAQRNLCTSKSVTVRFSGVDSLASGNYNISVNQRILDVINVPNKLECTFLLPSSFAAGTSIPVQATFNDKVLEVSNGVTIGLIPSKEVLTTQSPALCTGQNVSIFYSDSSNKSIHKYSWFRNDTLIPGANQYRLNTITQHGSYKGIVESEIGCSDTTSAVTVTQIGLCVAPSIRAQDLRFTNITSNSVSLLWRNGNGTRRIVLAKIDSVVNGSPSYGITYNASSQFGLGDSLGFRNYVVYNGSDNKCSVQGLIPGRRYHFAVIEYNQTGMASSYQLTSFLTGNFTTPAFTYYNKTTGNLNTLATWGINTDGTGASPTSFTTPAIFMVRNGTTPTFNGNWQLDTVSSVISIGVGSLITPLQFTVPSTRNVSCGNINLNGNAILNVTGTLITRFLNASDTSLVVYNGVSDQNLPPGSIGRFIVSGSVKTLTGNFWVKDTLRLNTNIAGNGLNQDTLTLGTKFNTLGHLIRISSTINTPFNRWIANEFTTGTNGLLPLGPNNRLFQLNITTVANDSGNILIRSHFIPRHPGNSGLPFVDDGINVNVVSPTGYWRILNAENREGLVYSLTATLNNFGFLSSHTTTRLVYRPLGGNWQSFAMPANFSGNTSLFTILKDNVMEFGEFALGGDISINPGLPVNLLVLEARKQSNNTVKLLWQTASETNSDYFEIQRSIDAKQFESIGAVNAAGTSSVVRNYEFIDVKLQQERTYYYRLRMLDKDGSEEYSQVVSVNLDKEQPIQVYPNPVKNILTIEGATEMIYIYSATGLQMIPPTTQSKIDVSEFPQGLYIIQTGNSHIKFVKQ